MKTRMFGMAVAVASLIVLTSGRNLLAQTAPQSDELRILDTTGLPMADIIIPETTGPGTQPSALFAPGIGVVGLVAPGALTGTIPPPGFPGLSYVILTEPSGEPVDPNELPPVIFTGPNGNVTVSDLLINSSAVTSPAFIALVSDNNPDLERYVSAIPAGTPVPVLVETGASQNLTPFIGPTPGLGQITVVVQSDITTVPEPSTFALAALGAAALYLVRRVGAHRKAPH